MLDPWSDLAGRARDELKEQPTLPGMGEGGEDWACSALVGRALAPLALHPTSGRFWIPWWQGWSGSRERWVCPGSEPRGPGEQRPSRGPLLASTSASPPSSQLALAEDQAVPRACVRHGAQVFIRLAGCRPVTSRPGSSIVLTSSCPSPGCPPSRQQGGPGWRFLPLSFPH